MSVQSLAGSVFKVGLINPLTIEQDYTLIAGLHRRGVRHGVPNADAEAVKSKYVLFKPFWTACTTKSKGWYKMRKRRKPPVSKEQVQNPSQQASLSGIEGGTQWKEGLLSTGALYSGQPYQRPVKGHVVDRLVREWDPHLLTPLVVSCRASRYNLVDGQHRVCGGAKEKRWKSGTPKTA